MTAPVHGLIVAITAEWVGAIGTWVAGFATLGAVLVAIYHDAIKQRLFGPKLHIEVPNYRSPDWWPRLMENDPQTFLYRLRVVNRKPSALVRNCRVLWIGSAWLRQHGDIPLMSENDQPHPMNWVGDPTQSFGPERVDFQQYHGLIFFTAACYDHQAVHKVIAVPRSGMTGNSVPFRVWYWLAIEADNFTSKQPQVFEIAWNGVPAARSQDPTPFITVADVTGKALVLRYSSNE